MVKIILYNFTDQKNNIIKIYYTNLSYEKKVSNKEVVMKKIKLSLAVIIFLAFFISIIFLFLLPEFVPNIPADALKI